MVTPNSSKKRHETLSQAEEWPGELGKYFEIDNLFEHFDRSGSWCPR